MLVSLPALPAGPHKCGVLVLGAGAVGLVTAIALARSGCDVTVLEAGPAGAVSDYITRNEGRVTGRPHKGFFEGRVRALGGTTRLWGGQLVPFQPVDFRASTFRGKRAWPIGHETLAPYYQRVLRMLGIDDPLDWDLWQHLGQTPPDLGPNIVPQFNGWLPVADFSVLFAEQIRNTPGLRIVTDSAASALQFSEDGKVAAVRCEGAGGERLFSADHVVLATGTVEIVRLLLEAKSQDAACPFAANENIGRGFIDHLHGIAGSFEVTDSRRIASLFDTAFVGKRKYTIKLRASSAFLESRAISNVVGTLNAKQSIRGSLSDAASLLRRLLAPSRRASLREAIPAVAASAGMILPMVWRYLVERRSMTFFERDLAFGLELEQVPVEASRLTLETVAGERPRVVLNWAIDGSELDAGAQFAEELAIRLAAAGLGKLTLDPRLVARDPSMFDAFHDAYHMMGGARAAGSASEGVVDADMRVFGSPNLYVAGAATFPSGSFANPTLTAMALGLRIADTVAATEAKKAG